jgi:hypothetical protein
VKSATADGTMKKATRRSPAVKRPRSFSATSDCSPAAALDISGSSAAETEMPKRLTGSV